MQTGAITSGVPENLLLGASIQLPTASLSFPEVPPEVLTSIFAPFCSDGWTQTLANRACAFMSQG